MGYFPFTASTALTNPMTALGDLIEGGAAGVPERLAIGTTGEVLTVSAGAPAWEASTGNTLTRVLFTVPSSGASHNAGANELTAVSTSAGFGTVVLPTGVPAGTANAVKQIIAGAGANGVVTVSTQGSDVFSFTGGATSQTLTLAGQALLAQYDGTSIWTVYADDLPASQIVVLGQDLGNTSALPYVVSTHLSVVTNAAATGTLNLDPTNTRAFVVTQTGNVTTFTLTSGSSYAANIEYSFDLYLNPVTYTTAWPANVTWAGGGSAPALVPSAVNLLVFTTVNQGTTWYASLVAGLNLPVTVADGGTGGAALGAYEVMAGGVTSASPVQSVAAGTAGQFLMSGGASALPAMAALPSAEPLTSGEALFERAIFNAQVALTASVLNLTYWTAVKTETVNHVKTVTGGTAAAGLTYANIGIFTVDGSGNLTLAASTGDLHTTLWTSTFTEYNSSLTSGFAKVAGTRYAMGLLAVGTTPPNVAGNYVSFPGDAPIVAGTASETTMPSTLAAGSISTGPFEIAFQAVVTP